MKEILQVISWLSLLVLPIYALIRIRIDIKDWREKHNKNGDKK